MRKVKTILRLSWEAKLSQREIAEALGVGKTTVQEVLARAQEMGLDWSQIQSIRESHLIEILYPPVKLERPRKDPDWAQIKLEVMRKGVTLLLLWEEYREQNPDSPSYSWFCENYKRWERNSRLVMRQTHKAGEKLFLDFAGLTVSYVDQITGEVRAAQIFVAVLGASNMTFAMAVEDQTVANWCHANVCALRFFGGVPAILVPDNLKAAVRSPSRYEPKIQSNYLDFAEHYNCAVIPARVRKPRDKAKVEVGVQVIERWILARLRKTGFGSIAEINSAIVPLLEIINNKTMRHLGKSRRELFEAIDKPALKPLPEKEFELVTRKRAKVNIDYHIELQRAYYSVPFQHVGQDVEIRYTRLMVEILHQGKVIAVHQRLSKLGARQTIPEHMPSHHRKMMDWNPQRILRWALDAAGPNTKQLCEALMGRQKHPEQGYRSCIALIRMADKYGSELLESTAAKVLNRNQQSVFEVEKLIRLEKAKQNPTSKVQHHENIRGAAYYN
ncbi:MAG: hypothetical protein RI953_1310 [Pseudomonadota bacterium]